jgi:DNA-damage-inducible protein J
MYCKCDTIAWLRKVGAKMAKTATMTMRLDPKVKAEVEAIYSNYGMSLSDAVTVFFHKSIGVRGLPFDLRPNQETLDAIAEVQDMKRHPERYKGYSNIDELFADALKAED